MANGEWRIVSGYLLVTFLIANTQLPITNSQFPIPNFN